jgi:uncharacterized protein YndB with AHSA1/START domain
MILNRNLDLQIQRTVPCSVDHLWKGWTDPETLKKWFCPRPWRVTECAIDLRPGGQFWTVMSGPNGERQENTGCYLEVTPKKRLVWTASLLPDFRPDPPQSLGFAFTAIVEFEMPPDGATLFRATVLHGSAENCKTHQEMGFEVGWGLALDQLLELAPEKGKR